MSSLLLLVLFLPLVLLLAAGDWRGGVLYSVVVGFLQDPLRKITPEQPPLYVTLVLVSLVLCALVLFGRSGRWRLPALVSGDRTLLQLLPLFFLLLALQALNSFGRFASLQLTAIGLGSYLAPLLGLWLGFNFALVPRRVLQFLRIYLVLAAVFLVSLVLDYAGFRSELFQEVGQGVEINLTQLGVMIQGYAGLWRSSEVAAWHLAAASCLLLILGVRTRRPELIAAAALLALGIMGVSTLTGRRKALTVVAGFVALYSLLVATRGGTRGRAALFAGGGLAVVLTFVLLAIGLDPSEGGGETFTAFLQRGFTVWSDIPDRSLGLVQAIQLAYAAGGPLGLGVGASTQGAAALGLQGGETFGSGESGVGKVLVELGLPGVLLLAWLTWALIRLYMRILQRLPDASSSYGLLNMGLLAFVFANIPVFAVASQIYGDPFVLSLIGLSAGFVLATPAVLASTTALAVAPAAGQLPRGQRPVLTPSAPSR